VLWKRGEVYPESDRDRCWRSALRLNRNLGRRELYRRVTIRPIRSVSKHPGGTVCWNGGPSLRLFGQEAAHEVRRNAPNPRDRWESETRVVQPKAASRSGSPRA